MIFFFFKQKTAYEMRISDWSSDVCSSDLLPTEQARRRQRDAAAGGFLELAVDVEDGLRELPVQALEALGEGVEVISRTGECRRRQQQEKQCEVSDGAHGMVPGVTGNEVCRRRSEEHTSELQSLMRISYAVFCLKKKKNDI